jgi:hypothetical protein
MKRLIVSLAVLFAALVPSALHAQPGKGIKLGEEVKGEIVGPQKTYLAKLGGKLGHSAELSVALKAGQNISLSATVVGKDRTATLFLYDPTGVCLHNSPFDVVKSAQLTFEEVSATGTYKIVVLSNLTGPFSLRTSDPSASDGEVKSLEARIEQLEKELAEARSKLKALRDTSNPPLRKGIEKK